MKHLPERLKVEMLDSIYRDIFRDFGNFFGESKLKYQLCYHLQPRLFDVGSEVIKKGHAVHEILMVIKGRVDISYECNGEQQKYSYVKNKFLLGMFEVLMKMPAYLSYVVADDDYAIPLDTLAIPRAPFLLILENGFPDDHKRLLSSAQANHNSTIEALMKTNKSLFYENDAISDTERNKARRATVNVSDFQSSKKMIETNIESLQNSYQLINENFAKARNEKTSAREDGKSPNNRKTSSLSGLSDLPPVKGISNKH